ncbi:MAG: efflux RND transporter periplasmic adaptor subunit [Rikenellaceae bacterium]
MKNLNLKRLSFLALAALSVVSCAEQAAPRRASAQKNYPTLSVSKDNAEVQTRYSSSIRSEEYVDVMPQISGVITSIKVKEGSSVKKGELLFIIDQVPYLAALNVAKANVKSAEASVATAKQTAESSQDLYDAKVISQNELQTAKNSLSAAEASLELYKAQEIIAQNNLSYTEVTSPISGTAGMVPYKIGALVSSSISEPLVTITNNDKMQVYFAISENQMLNLVKEAGSREKLLKEFPEVSLILNNKSTYSEKGKVDAISGNINSSTGTVSLRASFSNPEGILLDGGSGNIVISNTYHDIIVIPQVATYQIQNKIHVFKVIDNKAVSAVIEVEQVDNGVNYIVNSGLEVGDVIIASGAGLVREGMQVTGFPEKGAEQAKK